ncbi:hypothetical protein ADUPG1_005437, partial [Aduncisulcus paluster]
MYELPALIEDLSKIKCEHTGQTITGAQAMTYCYQWTKAYNAHLQVIRRNSSHKRDLVDLFVANLGDVPFTRRVKKALTNARAHGYKTTDPYELKYEDIEDVKRYVNQSLKHAMQFKAQFDQILGITA